MITALDFQFEYRFKTYWGKNKNDFQSAPGTIY